MRSVSHHSLSAFRVLESEQMSGIFPKVIMFLDKAVCIYSVVMGLSLHSQKLLEPLSWPENCAADAVSILLTALIPYAY